MKVKLKYIRAHASCIISSPIKFDPVDRCIKEDCVSITVFVPPILPTQILTGKVVEKCNQNCQLRMKKLLKQHVHIFPLMPPCSACHVLLRFYRIGETVKVHYTVMYVCSIHMYSIHSVPWSDIVLNSPPLSSILFHTNTF